MSDISVNANRSVYAAGAVGAAPQIIDVKTGAGTDRQGLRVTVAAAGGAPDVGLPVDGRRPADLEALLAVLGLDAENAKTASIETVLQAIAACIKQQQVSVTTCVSAMSDYDVARLGALKEVMSASDDPSAAKIVENVDRMMELKAEIEDLAKTQGMVYDDQFDESAENFQLNTRVREMGDRIADIRFYQARLGDEATDRLLEPLAPAMKQAVNDLLDCYKKTTGWGIGVSISYSEMAKATLVSYISVIASSDLQLPSQIGKDGLSRVLAEIADEISEQTPAEQVIEKLEEKMAEIAAQLADMTPPIQA